MEPMTSLDFIYEDVTTLCDGKVLCTDTVYISIQMLLKYYCQNIIYTPTVTLTIKKISSTTQLLWLSALFLQQRIFSHLIHMYFDLGVITVFLLQDFNAKRKNS